MPVPQHKQAHIHVHSVAVCTYVNQYAGIEHTKII